MLQLLAVLMIPSPVPQQDVSSGEGLASPLVEPAIQIEVEHVGPHPAAASLRVRDGERITFDVSVERLDPELALTDLRVRALYSTPGGIELPIFTSCSSSPFSAVFRPRNQEVVIALQETTNELRVYEIINGQFVLRHSVDLPARIEAIDIDDADNDGAIDIVIGLDGSSTPHHVRIYRYDLASDSLVEEFVSGTLAMHVEDVDVGDADNDGMNEIVVALERLSSGEPSLTSRVLMFEFENGVWTAPEEISLPEALSAQDVAIGDADGDGLNEVAVLFANILTSEASARQVRVYELVGNQWIRDDVTPMVTTGLTRAERLIIADVDQDPGEEIVTAFWGGSGNFVGRLVTLSHDGVNWNEQLIDDTVGIVDSLDTGDFDRDSFVDLVAGTGLLSPTARVQYYEQVGGNWQPPTDVSMQMPDAIIWDVELGDADDDFCNEILAAAESTVSVFVPGSTQPAMTLDFSVDLDSVQLGDVHNDQALILDPCDFASAMRCTRPFSIRASATDGGSWEIVFEATAMVPSSSGQPRRSVRARSRPIRIELSR